MRADPEDVVAFVEVARRGSFSAAARAMGLPKSSISRRVQKLEDALGTQLLTRTTRTSSLTEAGRGYLERAMLAIETLEGAEQVLEGMRDEPRGLLKITVPIDLSERVGELVDAFVSKYPEVRVATHVSNARVDLVREGYDLALRAGDLSDSTLVARKLMDSTLHLAASPGYLQRRGVPKRLADLCEHECLVFGTTSVHVSWQLAGPAGLETVKVAGVIASNDLGFLRQAAINGRGIGRFPRQQIIDQLEQGTLVRVLPEYCGRSPALYLVYPSASYLAPKVRRFVELCIEHKDSWTRSS